MEILISGGTGFIGSALCDELVKEDHRLYVLSRSANKVPSPLVGIESLQEIDKNQSFDAIINLAGETIAKRWTKKQKALIRSSRLDTTRKLIEYMAQAAEKPKVFISGSAIGYYGIKGAAEGSTGSNNEMPVAENGAGDQSFSSRLCQDWESIALEAEQMDIRTCLVRTGIVLGQGGALATMLPPFKMGLGGKMGSGDQWMPWIHMQDILGIIQLCLERENISGPINAVAPNPASNFDFTKALGRQIDRPTFFAMPSFAVKALMGKMGEELLLAGKLVVPQKALNTGYEFKYELLEEALKDILDS